MSAPHASRVFVALLLLLTVAAGWLRLRHIGFGLPEAVEPDCRIPFQVENLRAGGDWPRDDKELTWYPLVIARVAAAFPAPQPAPVGASVEQHLEADAAPYIQVRMAGALLALLAVPLTALLALRFVTPGWALLAAAFAATSLLHVGFSQQSRPHAASSATYLLAMLACLHLRRRGSRSAWALCGLALALAVGTLHSGIAMFLPLLVAWFLRARAGGRWLEPRLLIPVAIVALSLPVTYPFWFSPEPASMQVEGSVLRLAAHPVYLHEFNGAGFRILLRTFWFYEPVLLVLGAVGIAWFALGRRDPSAGRDPGRRADLLVVLAFVLPYGLVNGIYLHVYERFALPLIPYAAVLATWALSRLCAALSRPGSQALARGTSLALAALALALPIYASWRLVEVRGRPSTNELAARWLEQHLEPGAERILLTQPLDLPLARRPEGLLVNDKPPPPRSKYYWARYQYELEPDRRPRPAWDLRWLPLGRPGAVQRLASDPLGLLAEAGAELAVVEVFAPGRNVPAAAGLVAALRRDARRLARITPDASDDFSEHPFGYEDMTHVPAENFLARLLQARATGPVIEIFDLRPDDGR